jgi:branched-chain amino acid transport system permease protein
VRAAHRWAALAAATALLWLVAHAVPSTYVLGVLVFIALNAIAALGLSMVMGFAGQVSLGQAAFFAIGAYTSAVLSRDAGVPPVAAMGAAVVAGGVVAAAIGVPIFRLSGLLLAMATLGFGVIVYYVANNWAAVTGGPSGLTEIPPLSVGGVAIDTDARMLAVAGALLMAAVGLAANLMDSRIGRALRAIHGGEAAAAASGIDVLRAKVAVFAAAGALTALAGALYAHYVRFINPSPFGVGYSIELVVMVVLGGVASPVGAVFGAAAVVALVEALRALVPALGGGHGAAEYEIVLFGLVLMTFMAFLPGGLVGAWRRRPA